MNKGFTFKQFHVDDHGCGMPVSTDGVLLGAWASVSSCRDSQADNNGPTILDIGCGSGLLSLMAAQRTQSGPAEILALDIDPAAVAAAGKNFSASPWPARLQADKQDIREWTRAQSKGRFQTILCNPPYFNHGEQASCQRRATARHTDTLSHKELLSCLQSLLAPTGQASLILPVYEGKALLAMLADDGLYCRRLCRVKSTAAKPVHRLLMALSPQAGECDETSLTIHQHGQYSAEFIALTQDFYLKL
ncbi:tRNA1(Val) (adenine(37)-N6)-methyltransferase [Photobacterium halotolerans]|uniref:tRNA1(Val) (adenine(37)-N6)-methyltransferase n=1 Tax=Photobacterium halotolerans TaxID=265726 RepID=A0A0F5VIN7_9GAMM|nr:methyltransferase [Photobacterium halotolerans]KKD01697.1 SAM-dependent methlyltransferase [Photobacterium halotolerans]